MKAAIVILFSGVLIGCGTSTPRFAGHDSAGKTEQHAKKQTGPRFSSKHIEEEIKGDDKKVNARDVASRFAATPTPLKTSPASKRPPADSRRSASPNMPAAGIDNQKMMDVILGYLGTPYKYGGETKEGIDCSAFSSQVFEKSVNLKLPRSTNDQVKLGAPVAKNDLAFGDLIFFNTTGTNPSHVGIYIGDDLFAHASEAFGVTISSLESSYYRKKYTEARRVVGHGN